MPRADTLHRTNGFLKSRYLTALLFVFDAAAFALVWFGAYALRDSLAEWGLLDRPINRIHNYVLGLPAYTGIWLLACWYYGLYDHREKITGLNQVSRIVKTFVAALVASLSTAYLFKQWDIGRSILLLSAAAYPVWLFASRSFLRALKQAQLRRGIGITGVVIIGVGRTAQRVLDRIVNHPEGGYNVLGFVDPHPRRQIQSVAGRPVLGPVTRLDRILRRNPVDVVFLAVPKMPQNEMMNLIASCEDHGVQFKVVSNILEVITSQVRIDVIDEIPVIHMRNSELPFVQRVLKRAMDIAVASVLLLIFGLPMLVIALAVRLDSPGPALFRQVRIGKGGRPFTMLKFRTMRTDADPYAVAPTDPGDGRITRMGTWLRRFSFDEFPQLINVLQGHMSMVGPRPEMPFIVDQYEEWQRCRLDVKPGVTGLWQIVGRKNLPLALNLEYDFYYIKNQSLFFDIVILIKTIPAVVFGKGAF